jgi:ligand-binding sensor domain-containing protein
VASSLVAALAAMAAALAFRAERARSWPSTATPAAAPPSADPAPSGPEPLAACVVEEVLRATGAVTAILLASDGALWIGTGSGLVRRDAGGRTIEAALEAGERAVAGLAEQDGLVWAATEEGAVAFDGDRRVGEALGDEPVAALVRAGGWLLAGTARGLHRVTVDRGAEDLRVAGPGGEPVRPIALAAGEGTLWMGTASGAYAIPLRTLAAPLLVRTARAIASPAPSQGTSVVIALAPVAGGAVAGTDDGGLVFLRVGGEPHAARLADARANEVNAGAAALLGGVAILGTRGGLLVARVAGERLEVGRPAGLEDASVTAVRAGGGGLLVGTAEGSVLRLDCAGLHSSPGATAPREGGGRGDAPGG